MIVPYKRVKSTLTINHEICVYGGRSSFLNRETAFSRCKRERGPDNSVHFNTSLQEQHVSQVCKDAVVVTVPKVRDPKTLNDFRPAALTSILIKTLEELVKSEILKKTKHAFDPMQGEGEERMPQPLC